jgi:microcin C transport system substrate-binding protein
VIFHMRPEARFSDGTPLTAHDVVFTHNLFLEQGLPSYAEAVSFRVINAQALDDHTVRFRPFARNLAPVADRSGGCDAGLFARWFEDRRAAGRIAAGNLARVRALCAGRFEINRRITYRRNPDYWGWHLPNNVGRHNFDVVRVEYFADDSAAFEAFKTGEYTFRPEGNSRQWATGYDFPAVSRGHVVREELPDGTPPTPTGLCSTWPAPRFPRPPRARSDRACLQFRMDQPAAAIRADRAAPPSPKGRGWRPRACQRGRNWNCCNPSAIWCRPRC